MMIKLTFSVVCGYLLYIFLHIYLFCSAFFRFSSRSEYILAYTHMYVEHKIPNPNIFGSKIPYTQKHTHTCTPTQEIVLFSVRTTHERGKNFPTAEMSYVKRASITVYLTLNVSYAQIVNILIKCHIKR